MSKVALEHPSTYPFLRCYYHLHVGSNVSETLRSWEKSSLQHWLGTHTTKSSLPYISPQSVVSGPGLVISLTQGKQYGVGSDMFSSDIRSARTQRSYRELVDDHELFLQRIPNVHARVEPPKKLAEMWTIWSGYGAVRKPGLRDVIRPDVPGPVNHSRSSLEDCGGPFHVHSEISCKHHSRPATAITMFSKITSFATRSKRSSRSCLGHLRARSPIYSNGTVVGSVQRCGGDAERTNVELAGMTMAHRSLNSI